MRKEQDKRELTNDQLRKELEEILMAYIRLFEEKHDVDLQYIINDDIMGILDFGDVYVFNATDVVYDIDRDLPKGLILQWAEDSIDDSKNPTRQTINLHSYAQGLRFEDLRKNKRCNSQIRSKKLCTSKKAKCETKKKSKEK